MRTKLEMMLLLKSCLWWENQSLHSSQDNFWTLLSQQPEITTLLLHGTIEVIFNNLLHSWKANNYVHMHTTNKQEHHTTTEHINKTNMPAF